MVRYDKYLMYVLRHKWFVMIECFKKGLFIKGLFHDSDKFLPSSFIPYAKRFYGKGKDIKSGRDKTGYYNPFLNSEHDFQIALKNHVHRNKHHWQYWVHITKTNDDLFVTYPMSEKDIIEMICDWKGAGRAQGNMNYSPKEWFEINRKNMILHEDTIKIINDLLEEK